ncbi:MAG: DNA cytosine methyltransferase, partial [Anaerolineae bacterium]|nr:DNA cytosine methyltransferase [Anaerolineae bacterium]
SNGDANSGFRDEQGLIAMGLKSKSNRLDGESQTFIVSHPLRSKGNLAHRADMDTLIAFQQNLRDEVRWFGGDGTIKGALSTQPGMKQQTFLAPGITAREGTAGVRRLTPVECERLQGFPDGWTDGQSDTQRYKQLGNAVAVPCAEWIGKKIMEVEKC